MQVGVGITLAELIQYTDWQREKWLDWLQQNGDDALKLSAGPHGDGRLNTIGDIVRHIFSAEKRYVDRFSDREVTDTSGIPNDNADALFAFGGQSRSDLNQFVAALPPNKWDEPRQFPLMDKMLRASARKVMTHVLMHEIRHWAQIATMLRQAGKKVAFHDFLFCPVMGDPFMIGSLDG
jgi:uncharacterized damage-inducible protein DinB